MSKTKINVPKGTPPEFSVSLEGGEPLDLKVNDGTVSVPTEQADLFIRNFPGASLNDGTSATTPAVQSAHG